MINTASWPSLSVYLWYITHLNAIFIRCQLPLFHIWVTQVPEKYYNYQAPHPLAVHKPNVNHNDNHFPKEEEKDKPPLAAGTKTFPWKETQGRGVRRQGEKGQVHRDEFLGGQKSTLMSSLRSFFYYITNPSHLLVKIMH